MATNKCNAINIINHEYVFPQGKHLLVRTYTPEYVRMYDTGSSTNSPFCARPVHPSAESLPIH